MKPAQRYRLVELLPQMRQQARLSVTHNGYLAAMNRCDELRDFLDCGSSSKTAEEWLLIAEEATKDVAKGGDAWVEVDCPACGIDYDLRPPPVPGQPLPTCACGHVYTYQDMAESNFYRDQAICIGNPFRSAKEERCS